MDVLRTEEEQLQALREWWKENGVSAVLGIVAGLAAVFGWRAWQAHGIAEAEAASTQYQQLVAEVRGSESDKAGKAAAEILQNHPDTAYAVFAALIQAKLAVDASDLDAAASHLRSALGKNADPVLEKEIQLRLARVLASQAKYDEALALLDAGAAGAFAMAYDELRGDIEASRGNRDAARTAYERALTQTHSAGADSGVLEAKLNALGPKPSA